MRPDRRPCAARAATAGPLAGRRILDELLDVGVVLCKGHGALPSSARARERSTSLWTYVRRRSAQAHGRWAQRRSRRWPLFTGRLTIQGETHMAGTSTAAPGASGPARRTGARRDARGGFGRRARSRAQRLPGPDDRAPICALARQQQLRARSGRHVRGLARRLEADAAARRSSPAASRSPYTARARSTRCRCPSGSSATTPPVCVGVLDPTMRYFAANDGGLLSLMSVQILFYPPGGGVITLPLGVNVGGKAWAPSLPTLGHREPPRRAERWRGDGRLPLHARSGSARSGGSTTSTSIPCRH